MYEIDQQTVRFSNGKRYRFPVEVAEAMDFEDSIVVRLTANHLLNVQNIFALDYHGNLLWKIPTPRSFSPQNPYVGLSRKGSYVEVLNWDGHILTIHPRDGSIVGEDMYTGGASHSRRSASPRRWL
jgi:hypothetical protein